MKKLQLFILLFLFMLTEICAQDSEKPIRVTGQLKSNFRVVSVSKEIKNILFLQLKAQLVEPDMGYFLQLDKASSQKLQRDVILIIPVNLSVWASDNWYSYDRDITVDIYPVLGNHKLLHYTKDDNMVPDWAKERGNYILQWAGLSSSDTISWRDEIYYKDYRFTKPLIDLLDNDTEINFESYIRYWDDEGEYIDPVFTKDKISNLARKQLFSLHSVEAYAPPQVENTKKEYLEWFNNLPQPVFKKPEIEMDYKTSYWSSSSYRILHNRSLLQRSDNKHIYNLAVDTTYVMDTEKDTLIKLDKSVVLKDLSWDLKDKFIDETVNNRLKELGWLHSKAYVRLSNGDILAAYVKSNNFEQQLYVFVMKKDTYKESKRIYLDSYIPLESNSDSGIKIKRLFEAYNKYYIILNVGRSYYWGILDSKIFN